MSAIEQDAEPVLKTNGLIDTSEAGWPRFGVGTSKGRLSLPQFGSAILSTAIGLPCPEAVATIQEQAEK